jgi:hypothetical protein
MRPAVRRLPRDFTRTLAELGNALQTAVLLAGGLERALCDTHWQHEAGALRRAVDRAARATLRLGELARPPRPRSPRSST